MFSTTVQSFVLVHQLAVAAGEDDARRSSRVARAGLALASLALLALGLLAAELTARVLAPGYLARTRGPHVFSRTLGWSSRKGLSAEADGARVSVNARGYRGRALALPRPRGLTRVVVLGDSIAFGLHVSDDETFPSLLDARPNGLEVANLSVLGYGPDQELLVLERDGLPLEPDVVVLFFCLANDFAEAMLPVSLYDGRSPKPRFHLEQGRLVLDATAVSLTPLASTLQQLADHSHLYNRVASLVPRGPAPPGPHWRERYAQALQDEERALRTSLAIVGRMQELCVPRGIRFLVALMPDRFSYRTKPPLAERFAAALAAAGIEVLDLSRRFRDDGLRLTDVALDGTGHLSPDGHRRVSEALEAVILGSRPSPPR